MKKFLAMTGMAVALGTGSMFGAIITQTQSFTSAPTDITDPQSSVTFQDFRTAPGFVAGDILNSVTLEVLVNETVTALTITNNDPNLSHSFTYQTTGEYAINGSAPDAGNLSAALPFSVLVYTTGPRTIAGGSTSTFFPPGTASKNTDTGVLTSATPSAYDIAGTFTLSYDTLTGETFIGGGGNEMASQTTVSGATYTVVYNFTAPTTSTPEPATMTLFGSALLGIGFFARKRIKKS
jgi:hypothetical protein